ncbi:MAG TPA: hypothetical protein VHM19_22885 [Polyangiales bacterium]|jgi:hypothetical protein|nr:hypothetical protein [Polyangiales bacterium]
MNRFALLLTLLLLGCHVKEITVRPLGIVTQPNKYGWYDAGALSVARNVMLRDPGVLSSVPGLQNLRANALANGYTARQLFAGDAYQLAIGDDAGTWNMRWVNGAGATAITSPAAFAHSFSTGIAPVARQRGRTIVGSANGPLVLDSETDTTARLAGLGRPYIYGAFETATGWLATGKQVGYVARIRRVHSDGYETNGPFSGRYLTANDTGASEYLQLRVAIESNTQVAAGDIVELYRTRVQTTPAEVGDTYLFVKAQTVAAADVANKYLDITDDIAETSLGDEALIAPGLDGPLKNQDAPPLARDIVVHQDHVFYLGTTTPALLNEYVSGAMNSQGSALTGSQRATGIGWRAFTGTVTNGSATITAISGADMVGLAVGQHVFQGANIDGYITVVGATSVTLNNAATGSAAAAACTAVDQITINGHRLQVSSFWAFSAGIGAPAASGSGMDAFAFVADKQPSDNYAVTDVSGFKFALGRQFAYEGSFTVQASNGKNYYPPIADYSAAAQTVAPDQRLNRVHWAEADKPEATPINNKFLVGNGEIYRGVSVGGVVLVFCSDGLWVISGDANGWIVNQKDPTLILASRLSVCVMDEIAWAYTNQGLVAISASGDVTPISRGKIGQAESAGEFAGSKYADTWDTRLCCDEAHHEVLVTTNAGDDYWVYSGLTSSFCKRQLPDDATAITYSRALTSLLYGTATAGGPSLQYHLVDSSSTRLANALVKFQPLVGGDPSAQKDWLDLELAFEGVSSALTLVPQHGGTNYLPVTVPVDAAESRVRLSVPNNAPAQDPRLVFGFSFSAGDTATAWSFRMMAASYEPVSPEPRPR